MRKHLKERRKPAKLANGSRSGELSLGPLRKRIGYALRRAQLAVFNDFFEAFAEVGVRPAQYSVLTIIEHNPGVAQGRVANVLGIQKTNFIAIISTLERRSLLHRQISNEDRRVLGLFLTPKGQKLMKKLHAIAEKHEMRMLERVGSKKYHSLFAPLWQIVQRSSLDKGQV